MDGQVADCNLIRNANLCLESEDDDFPLKNRRLFLRFEGTSGTLRRQLQNNRQPERDRDLDASQNESMFVASTRVVHVLPGYMYTVFILSSVEADYFDLRLRAVRPLVTL